MHPQGDPGEAYRRLQAWLDRVWPGRRVATLQELAALHGDKTLKTERADLLERLYARKGRGAEGWSGERLAGGVDAARGRLLHTDARAAGPALSPLNPE